VSYLFYVFVLDLNHDYISAVQNNSENSLYIDFFKLCANIYILINIFILIIIFYRLFFHAPCLAWLRRFVKDFPPPVHRD